MPKRRRPRETTIDTAAAPAGRRDESRPRQRGREVPPPSEEDLARFASFLAQRDAKAAADEKARRAAAERRRREEEERTAAARHEAAVRAELASAVEALKEARRRGRGVTEAEVRWRAASAAVLELETGTRPEWAPSPASDGAAEEVATAEDAEGEAAEGETAEEASGEGAGEPGADEAAGADR